MTRRTLVAGAALLAALASGTAHAEDAPAGGEQATLTRLEQRSKSFYDLLERGERERATAAWPGLEADLASFGDALQGRLDRLRDEVVERDGDLDELYRSPRWRDAEVASLVVTYHLAWVRYQGAQLVGEPARKRSLLQKAVEGFSRFVLVNEVPDIFAESLYGRGLAFLDLGESQKAIEDFTAAAEEPRVAAKARAALEEARRRVTGRKTPAENDPEALLVRVGDLLPRAAGDDAGAEKDATALARGLAARGGPWPARVVALVGERLGGGATTGVRSSYGLFLLAQLAVDRGRCADVAALAAASAGATDAARARHRPEILFLDAGCRLNAGAAREAADGFATLLREFPDAAHAREAGYYRFRALDVARADDAAVADAYEQALSDYLGRWGRAEGAPEARFLLAELHRSRGDSARAAREYAEVAQGPFATRARLGALECRVTTLATRPGERPGVLADLRAFVHDTPPRGDQQALVARAALLGAAVAAGASPADQAAIVELLDGFEARYPEARDLHARALGLRLGARVAQGDLAAAGQDLERFLAARTPEAERRTTLLRLGRELATRAERGDAPERDRALTLARKVYTALAAASGDPRDRITLAELQLRAGDATAARRGFEEVLAKDAGSSEALRGAARAAAAAGDRAAALGYWRQVVDASPTGGTGWYEARLAQVTLLADDGHAAEACEVLRLSRGRATSAGADQLEARLRGMEGQVCR